jgi:hypothetical protein
MFSVKVVQGRINSNSLLKLWCNTMDDLRNQLLHFVCSDGSKRIHFEQVLRDYERSLSDVHLNVAEDAILKAVEKIEIRMINMSQSLENHISREMAIQQQSTLVNMEKIWKRKYCQELMKENDEIKVKCDALPAKLQMHRSIARQVIAVADNNFERVKSNSKSYH